jgi:phosphohistidine swiveling domain-containing protein
MIKKTNRWEYIVDRAYVPFSYSINIYSNEYNNIKRVIPIKKFPDAHFYEPNDLYWEVGCRESIINYEVARHKREGNKFLWSIAKKCEAEGTSTIKYIDNLISANDLSIISDKSLNRLFMLSGKKLRQFTAFLVVPWVMEKYLDELLDNIISSRIKNEKDAQYFKQELSLPIKYNYAQKEKLALLKIIDIIFKSQKEKQTLLRPGFNSVDLKKMPATKRLISKFLKDYSWLSVRWMMGSPFTPDDVINRIREIVKTDWHKELKLIQETISKRSKALLNFSKKYHLSSTDRDTLKLIGEYVYIRTYRTDELNRGFSKMTPIVQEMARRLALSFSDILFLTLEEVSDYFISGNIKYIKLIKKRKKRWAVIRDKKIQMFDGQEAKAFVKNQNLEIFKNDHQGMKGVIAFGGKARGIAKVVINPNMINKVKRGDIFVAVMTFPSYIMAMEKAAAFVTQEGGLLCHASIVAREMKKPCLISVKNITKIIKDGDLIEVDANKGIIKIITK